MFEIPEVLSVLAWVAMIKCHKLEVLTEIYFLKVPEAGISRSGCQQGQILVSALFLAYR